MHHVQILPGMRLCEESLQARVRAIRLLLETKAMQPSITYCLPYILGRLTKANYFTTDPLVPTPTPLHSASRVGPQITALRHLLRHDVGGKRQVVRDAAIVAHGLHALEEPQAYV